jgi:hypothetical protein
MRSLKECSNVKKNYVQRLSVTKTAVGDLLDFHQRLILIPISLRCSLMWPYILRFWSSDLLVSKRAALKRHVFCRAFISSVVLPVLNPAQIANVFVLSACIIEEW